MFRIQSILITDSQLRLVVNHKKVRKSLKLKVVKIRRALGNQKQRYNLESFKIGQTRQRRLIRILSRNSYHVEYSSLFYNGVDIKAWKTSKDWDKDEPDIVIESTNYKKSCYIGLERAKRYVRNLNKYPNSRKIIVVSYWNNIKVLAPLFRANNIEIKIMGKQELPPSILAKRKKVRQYWRKKKSLEKEWEGILTESQDIIELK